MGKGKGIVLSGPDKTIEAQARNKGLGIVVDPSLPLAFDKTLFVEPGTEIPWDLLPAAWHFLERWDAAVPLWRYGKTAADLGSKEERAQTQAVIRDLRVLVHSVELLFVRNNEDGQALMAAYREELGENGDKRLSFLRALYLVKPRLCVLPVTWLAKVAARSKQDAIATRGRGRPKGARLVEVEVGPGRFVKCNPGDEDAVLAMMQSGRNRNG
jgi:hypothetical protein